MTVARTEIRTQSQLLPLAGTFQVNLMVGMFFFNFYYCCYIGCAPLKGLSLIVPHGLGILPVLNTFLVIVKNWENFKWEISFCVKDLSEMKIIGISIQPI